MDRLRVALIGPGFIAQRHLEVLSAEPGAELSGSCRGPGRPRRGAAVRRPPVRRARRLLDAERPEAVWVCLRRTSTATSSSELMDAGST